MTTPAAVKRSRRQRPTGALSQHQWGRVVHHCARLTTLWRRAAAEVVATQGDAEEEDDEREGSGARFRFPTALGTPEDYALLRQVCRRAAGRVAPSD